MDEIPKKGVDSTHVTGGYTIPCSERGTRMKFWRKTLIGNNLQVVKEKFQQESSPKPKSRVALHRKSWPRRISSVELCDTWIQHVV